MRSWQSLASGEYALMLACALVLMAYSSAVLAGINGPVPSSQAAMPALHRAGTTALAAADHGDRSARQTDRDHAESAQPAIGPEQAARRARQRFGGRVLNVVLEHGPGGPYYRVKILKQGRVRVVDIDARR